MTAKAAYKLFRKNFRMEGLHLLGWTFGFDNARRRFGYCHHGKKRVSISLPLTLLNNRYQVFDTIQHELAHALIPPYHGHDRVWREKALSLGCNGQRCYKDAEVEKPLPKFQATCAVCGYVAKRYKNPYGRRYSCARCSGGRYQSKFLLTFHPITP